MTTMSSPRADSRPPAAAAPEGRESGFSFVEVIIAMGVLAGVLIAIASMFLLGGRQVKAGKTITSATALCQDIMETFETRSFTAIYTSLGAAATATSHTALSTTTGSGIDPWQTEINRKLEGGVATVTLTPLGPGTPNFGAATAIRVQVSLAWSELGRPQTVRLSTVRF